MDNQNKELIEGLPAGYPATSSSEIESRNILQFLLGSKHIRGEIKVMDKYPNSDGILEIIDEARIPIAKIDIQLKTLEEKNYKTPKYQCDRSFLAYCQNSILPVILFVVNVDEKKAFWLHVNRAVILEASNKINGNSVSISIPVQNCIDGVTSSHFYEWGKIAKEIRKKIWNYDSMFEQQKSLELRLNNIIEKTENPLSLPLPITRELHKFLDEYNYILDIEFTAIKNILYPNFWKIGMGIISYTLTELDFVMYPIEYNKNQTLIKEVELNEKTDLFAELSAGNILQYSRLSNSEKIRNYPKQYAYEDLDDVILKTVQQNNLPIPDVFLANEYLISFIDRYHLFLGFEKFSQEYSLKDLKFRLNSLLPLVIAIENNFAEWVTECSYSIDSYSSFMPSDFHRRTVITAQKMIKEGTEPKVKVTIVSELYNLELINFYIDLLFELSNNTIRRVYQINQKGKEKIGEVSWKAWNKDALCNNFQIFINNFHRCYQLYIEEHFPRLKKTLKISEEDYLSLFYLLNFDDTKATEPVLEIYYLRPLKREQPCIYFFKIEESPINRYKYWVAREFDCTVNEQDYTIVRMEGMRIDFMFDISPTYSYIKKVLLEKLKKYFSESKKI